MQYSRYLQTKGAVCLIDDDEIFLQMMALLLSANYRVLTFVSTSDAIHALREANLALIREEQEIAEMLATDDSGERIRRAVRWLNRRDRECVIETVFVDYNMPSMDGLTLLGHIDSPRLQRVLLTGQAGTDEAVDAFNRQLIDAYLPKGSETLSRLALNMARSGARRKTDLLWRGVPAAVMHALESNQARGHLESVFESLSVIEHILLPDPAGYLCRTHKGALVWVQLETQESLRGAIEILRDCGWSQAQLAPLMKRERTAPVEFVQALGHEDISERMLIPLMTVSTVPWTALALYHLPESDLPA